MKHAADRWVLDASALLALANQEQGSERVFRVLPGAAISAVNASETAAALARRGAPISDVQRLIKSLELEIVAFDEALAWRTAALRLQTHGVLLSLADRACLATAEMLGASVLTADREWRKLRGKIPIELIR